MNNLFTRVNVTLPPGLVSELKRIVPNSKRSSFVANAVTEKLIKLKRDKALASLSGVWDKSGGAKFDNEVDLSTWRSNLWSSWENRLKTNEKVSG